MKAAFVTGSIGMIGIVFSSEAKRSAADVMVNDYKGIPGVLEVEYYVMMSNVFFTIGVMALMATVGITILENIRVSRDSKSN